MITDINDHQFGCQKPLRSLLTMRTFVLLLALTVNTLARQLSHRYVTVEIGESECDVHDFGAKGDGKTDDTMVTSFALEMALTFTDHTNVYH